MEMRRYLILQTTNLKITAVFPVHSTDADSSITDFLIGRKLRSKMEIVPPASNSDFQISDPGKRNELGYGRINFNSALLAVPSMITGPATISCTTAQTYSIPAIPGATYQWIVPTGIQIVSRQGTRSTTLKEYQGGTSTKRPITIRVTEVTVSGISF